MTTDQVSLIFRTFLPFPVTGPGYIQLESLGSGPVVGTGMIERLGNTTDRDGHTDTARQEGAP